MRYYLPLAGLAMAAQASTDKTCKAIILGGGGSYAAYETGFIWGLINYDNQTAVDEGKYEYDVVTGVSGGSINAAAVASFPIGQERDMADWMVNKWNNLSTPDVLKKWDAHLPIIHGLFDEAGLFDTSPLNAFLNQTLQDLGDEYGHEFKRKFNTQATDMNSGVVVQFSEKDLSFDQFYQALMASSSYPIVFPPYYVDGYSNFTFADGGIEYGPDFPTAIHRCREMGFSDEQITVDALVTYYGEMNTNYKVSKNAFTNWKRAREIKKFWNGMNQILAYLFYFPDVNFRYLGIPTSDIGGNVGRIDFSKDRTWPIQELGRHDAQEALNKGEGFLFDYLKAYNQKSQAEKQAEPLAAYMKKILDELSPGKKIE